jgi:hypothetical protein
MKNLKKSCFALVAALAFFSGCKADLLDTRYTLELPALPPAWEELFGIPCWRIEWLNPGGEAETLMWKGTGESARTPEISLPQTRAAAVSALPFFPDRGIQAGLLRPAGAVFPFDVPADVSTGKSSLPVLRLSWQGGVDAVLYRELGIAAAHYDGSSSQSVRLPQNLDWPRFRELFSDPDISDKVRTDPWTVDWKTAADKIIRSGFNKRYITGEETTEIQVPAGPGPWIGSSPFVSPLFFDERAAPSFPAGENTSIWFSDAGILKVNKTAWILVPWGE